MALLRTLPLRAVARAGGARSTLRPGRLPRRSYASGAGEQAKKVGSDMPWLAGAVVAAVVPTVLIVRGADLHNPLSYPKPGSHYHGGEHGDDHGDEDSEESQDDGEKEGESEDSGEEKPDEQADEKADKDISKDWQEVGGDGESGSRTLKKEDAKGGVKRRVESGNALKQGSGENDDDNANKKTPVAGSVSKQQAGISNTDTKHSSDVMQSEHSKKAEGAPDTAKLTGTVDPHRGKSKE